MKIRPLILAEYNQPLLTNNRFYNPSLRGWRPELHMRFWQAFEKAAERNEFPSVEGVIKDAFDSVVSPNILKLGDKEGCYYNEFIQKVGLSISNWLAPFRLAAYEPANPHHFDDWFRHYWWSFLANLRNSAADLANGMAYLRWPIDEDDFKVFTETGRFDAEMRTSKGVNEAGQTRSDRRTHADILTGDLLSAHNEQHTNAADDYRDSGNNTVQDSFLSAQNQGVKPHAPYQKGGKPHEGRDKGANGMPGAGDPRFSTTQTTAGTGASTLGNNSHAAQGSTAGHNFQQNNDIRTEAGTGSELSGGQAIGIDTRQGDAYDAGTTLNRPQVLSLLQEFFSQRFWAEFQASQSNYILQMDNGRPRVYNHRSYYD